MEELEAVLEAELEAEVLEESRVVPLAQSEGVAAREGLGEVVLLAQREDCGQLLGLCELDRVTQLVLVEEAMALPDCDCV